MAGGATRLVVSLLVRCHRLCNDHRRVRIAHRVELPGRAVWPTMGGGKYDAFGVEPGEGLPALPGMTYCGYWECCPVGQYDLLWVASSARNRCATPLAPPCRSCGTGAVGLPHERSECFGYTWQPFGLRRDGGENQRILKKKTPTG